ncbi:MAG: CXXX repeat peptide maturase [Bacteroidaceae bacterium]|nr:CXXX repeat peptide maturase [Bacteroidaceae bacterium]
MLQYLIIQLDDTSTSYCHYTNIRNEKRLISLDDLRAGILWAMKENLMIQYVLPDYELPAEYIEEMESIDNSKIVSSHSTMINNADVIVLNGWEKGFTFRENGIYVLRITKDSLFAYSEEIKMVLPAVTRLNIVITDVETFTDADCETYKIVLESFAKEVEKLYVAGKSPQLNLLTDRMMLDKMNNCNAGYESITLAPDGCFYVCPAFYLANEDDDFGLGKSKYNVGNLIDGLDIKNPQLYRLDHAPICRHCDAYQCKRCVWLNRKTTYEVNTPSREQCVVAHIERNVAAQLLTSIRTYGEFLPERNGIEVLECLDPFEKANKW